MLLAKIKIDDALHRAKPAQTATSPKAETISSAEGSLLSALKSRLGELNSDIDHLLREGILSLYMDLCDLREKFSRIKVSKVLEGLLRTIIEIVSALLKPFFIYQEYHRCQVTPNQRKKNILSLRNLNTNSHLTSKPALPDFDEKLMREVEEALSRKPVAELLEAFMKYACVHSARKSER